MADHPHEDEYWRALLEVEGILADIVKGGEVGSLVKTIDSDKLVFFLVDPVFCSVSCGA